MDLKLARRIARITQEELAAKAKVDVSLVSRLERGLRPKVAYDAVVRIARALNLSAEELFPVEDAPALSTVGPPAPRRRGRPAKVNGPLVVEREG
jgi:transcriptional regulator with XRE-family HTH domain